MPSLIVGMCCVSKNKHFLPSNLNQHLEQNLRRVSKSVYSASKKLCPCECQILKCTLKQLVAKKPIQKRFKHTETQQEMGTRLGKTFHVLSTAQTERIYFWLFESPMSRQ